MACFPFIRRELRKKTSVNKNKEAETLFNIFKGLEDAYGCYEIVDQGRSTVKKSGNAMTVSKPLTIMQWQDHVNGKMGLGVIPITRKNTCWWACMDIDSYDGFDHRALLESIFELNLPILVCKSKSGGAHCFVFFKEDVPCVDVRQFLTKVSIMIGHAGCEVFPKQDKLLSNMDKGNWLNMPYYLGKERLCTIIDGEKTKDLNLAEFAKMVEAESLTSDDFYDIFDSFNPDNAKNTSDDDMLDNAPPCMVLMVKNQSIGSGNRNDLMTHFGTYAAKRWGKDKVEDYLPYFNEAACQQPLDGKELNGIIRSMKRDKDYRYKCSHPLCKANCNPSVCASRKFGIDARDATPTLRNLMKVEAEKPLYFVDTDFGRLQLTAEELNNPKLFQKAHLEQLNHRTAIVKDFVWTEIINDLMKTLIKITPPEDTSCVNDIMNYIKGFVRDNRNSNRNVLKEGGGVYEHSDGFCYFKLNDMFRLLNKQGIIDKNTSKTALSLILDEHDITQKKIKISSTSGIHVRGIELDSIDLTEDVDIIDIETCEIKNGK